MPPSLGRGNLPTLHLLLLPVCSLVHTSSPSAMAASRMISRATPTHKNPTGAHHHHHHHHHHHPNAPDDPVFEFEESDLVWSSNDDASSDPRTHQPRSLKKLQRRPSAAEAPSPPGAASLPVNIPDWSKILLGDYKEHHRGRETAKDGGSDDGGEEDDGDRVPPHEFLARRRGASLSVHEGVGRTLKGRDLRSVRNAIWEKVGFED